MNFLEPDEPLLVIIGPSAVGKSSLLRKLRERELIEVTPSWTTRPARPAETNASLEHRFISDDEFFSRKRDGFFLETIQLFNLPYHYGLPKISHPKNGQYPTIVLRTYLLPIMQKHYKNAVVYSIEDEFAKVAARLHLRTKDGELQGDRLEEFEREIKAGRAKANRIFKNQGTISELADEVAAAIDKDFNH